MPTLFDRDTLVGFVRVAVERGVDRYPEGLTYAARPPLHDLAPGERVIVPLGPSNADTPGCVVERLAGLPDDLDPAQIKEVRARDDAARPLPGQLVELSRWIAGYYCTPIGMTLATVLPAAVKRHVGLVSRTLVDLPQPTALPELPKGSKITATQRRVLDLVASTPAAERPIEARRLAGLAGLRTTAPIRRMVERRLLAASSRTSVEAAWQERAVDRSVPQRLTPAQETVVDSIGAALPGGFSAHLLFGVTGSGKTEVYIRLISQVVAAGRTALLLVPEIALTPQTGGRLIGRFPDHRVAVLHSGLTAAQRHQQWFICAAGKADIVLGARSAVFAPVPDGRLGLIVVDEEHDASYKQDQAPRYHGRDVAVRRAQLADCPVLLASATPSLESWHNATARGTYRLHRLSQRVPGLHLPKVHVVDFRQEMRRRTDRRVHVLGPLLERAIGDTLQGGGNVLLLLNRRGFANYIACPDHRCGWMLGCDHCDTTMVYHVNRRLPSGGFVRCHHCLTEQPLPAACPVCGNRVSTFGLGTQRVEAELERKFPLLVDGQTMLRVDSDSMRGAADFHDALGRFASGSIRLLIGTQMIAKGLDFPVVRLVGVVNADTSIHLPDFRSTERTFQLVSQVAGRCGRGADPGRVIVQTFQPETAAIRLAAAHDFERFAAGELAERARSALPPVTRLCRIVLRDADLERCRAAAGRLATELRRLAGPLHRVLGPAPCPIARIAGRHRQQIEILAPSAAELQSLLVAARNEGLLRPGASMAIDVDPVSML